MDDRERQFQTWAPPTSPWSAWAKPVLFAHRSPAMDGGGEVAPVDVTGLPAGHDGTTAVVVDLPGPAGVATGLALARRGYRPVPLYNAVPGPPGRSAVDVWAIAQALAISTVGLRDLRLADDAPPAFLLDADRRIGNRTVRLGPGTFDNRSVSLPTDFPSADRLRAAGVRQVVVVQQTDGPPQADLAHTLRRWQDGGLPILRHAADAPPGRPPVAIAVGRPGGFRSMWHGVRAVTGLRSHPLGGFGGTLPVPSAG